MNYEKRQKRKKDDMHMADGGSNEFMIKVSYPTKFISVWI